MRWHFTDVTKQAGAEWWDTHSPPAPPSAITMSTVVGIVVCHYVYSISMTFQIWFVKKLSYHVGGAGGAQRLRALATLLFHNNETANLREVSQEAAWTIRLLYGWRVGRRNGDGRLDLFVANRCHPELLLSQ